MVRLARTLAPRHGGTVLDLPCDVTDAAQVQVAADAVLGGVGRARHPGQQRGRLPPGALRGRPPPRTSTRSSPPTSAAPWPVARAFLPTMRAGRGGLIVTIGCVADHVGFPGNSGLRRRQVRLARAARDAPGRVSGAPAAVHARLTRARPTPPCGTPSIPIHAQGFTPRARMLRPGGCRGGGRRSPPPARPTSSSTGSGSAPHDPSPLHFRPGARHDARSIAGAQPRSSTPATLAAQASAPAPSGHHRLGRARPHAGPRSRPAASGSGPTARASTCCRAGRLGRGGRSSSDTTAGSLSWDFVHAIAFGPQRRDLVRHRGQRLGPLQDGGATWRNWTLRELGPEWQYVAPAGIIPRGDTDLGRHGGRGADDSRRRRPLDRLRRCDRPRRARPGRQRPRRAPQRICPADHPVPYRDPAVDAARVGRHSREPGWQRSPSASVGTRDSRRSPASTTGRARSAGSARSTTAPRATTRRAAGAPAEAPAAPRTTWFGRPIALADNSYIDQTYRYGSTMGGNFQQHQGVEFNNPDGTPVHAIGSGVVVYAGPAEAGALTVAIRHDSTLACRRDAYIFSVYYHNSALKVSVGQRVNTGDVICEVGNTGRATNDHLHLEVHAAPTDRCPVDCRFAAALPGVHDQSRALDPAAARHRHRRGAGARRGRQAGGAGQDLRHRQAGTR